MDTAVFADRQAMGAAAGARAAEVLRAALAGGRRARLLLAAAPSQRETLASLAAAPGIAWERVECLHLDEYLGLDAQHPASFRSFLRRHFFALLPTRVPLIAIAGEAADAETECRRLAVAALAAPIDLGLLGIGENAHLAFNDPPVDFAAPGIYHVVELDETCRRQQVADGCFASLDTVPRRAISMTIPGLLAARSLVVSVPGPRKRAALAATLAGRADPRVPATALHGHPDCLLCCDRDAWPG